MKRLSRRLWIWALALSLALVAGPALADETITAENWQKIKGMVPDTVLEWVKKGDTTITIVDQLAFNTTDIMNVPGFVAENVNNKGKYAIKDGSIIDTGSGKTAGFISGLPFPGQLDASDPDAFYKLNYNRYYNLHRIGSIRFVFLGELIGRKAGLEKKVMGNFLNYSFDGYAPQKDVSNPQDIMFMSINNITSPYDMKGVASMMWRYRGTKKDMCYNYLPGIRRVRRGSPAGRSDAFAGSDLALDDQGGYQGQVAAMKMRVIEEKTALVPWIDVKPVAVRQNKKGEWVTGKDAPLLDIGFRKAGWKGAPWAMPGLKYVKRTVWIGEMISKDPSYNYGLTHMWCDKETGMACYKVNYDRKKEYWKTMVLGLAAFAAKDDPVNTWFEMGCTLIVDDRADHGTVIEQVTPKYPYIFQARNERNDFSLGGFKKYCK
jgi:hypothetical protein